jgi:phage-related minor tail protein
MIGPLGSNTAESVKHSEGITERMGNEEWAAAAVAVVVVVVVVVVGTAAAATVAWQ